MTGCSTRRSSAGAPSWGADSLLPSISVDGERVRYEDALRGIGLLVDRIGWHEVVLIQTTRGFHLKGVSNDAPVDRLIDSVALGELLGSLPRGRDVRETPRRRLWPR